MQINKKQEPEYGTINGVPCHTKEDLDKAMGSACKPLHDACKGFARAMAAHIKEGK